MKQQLLFVLFAVLAAVVCAAPEMKLFKAVEIPRADNKYRIVSLSPSVTEVLYKLGLGDYICAVTRFCVFPDEARSKPKAGGHFDVNYEFIAALKPTHVVGLSGQRRYDFLKRMNIRTVEADHSSLRGIIGSFTMLGDVFGVKDKAAKEADALRRSFSELSGIKPARCPGVFICVGREPGRLSDLYAAGTKSYLSELLELAGGKNIFINGADYARVSCESVISMNPDIIFDIMPDAGAEDAPGRAQDWSCLVSVNAVRSADIEVFYEDYAALPGPRCLLIAQKMKSRIMRWSSDMSGLKDITQDDKIQAQ